MPLKSPAVYPVRKVITPAYIYNYMKTFQEINNSQYEKLFTLSQQ
jgi:hypothetical protein